MPPEIALRIKMLRIEADGCIDAKTKWEVSNNPYKRPENMEALRQAAIVLYARAMALEEADWS